MALEGGLPCAKVLIDRGIQNRARTECLMSLAELFKDGLEVSPTQEALAFLEAADEQTAKALHVLEKSLGLDP